jgi:hypothetical protein
MAKKQTSVLRLSGQVELTLHAACVKAGSYCIAQGIIQRFPLAKPFLAKSLQESLTRNKTENIQKQLIRTIYKQHDLKPATWEVSAIIAVASTSANQFIDFKGVELRVKKIMGNTVGKLILKYAPLSQWLPELIAVVAQTWAIGRYADSVCRIRKLGSSWLPAPLAKSLQLPKNILWSWTEEAFNMALPIIKKINR